MTRQAVDLRAGPASVLSHGVHLSHAPWQATGRGSVTSRAALLAKQMDPGSGLGFEPWVCGSLINVWVTECMAWKSQIGWIWSKKGRKKKVPNIFSCWNRPIWNICNSFLQNAGSSIPSANTTANTFLRLSDLTKENTKKKRLEKRQDLIMHFRKWRPYGTSATDSPSVVSFEYNVPLYRRTGTLCCTVSGTFSI